LLKVLCREAEAVVPLVDCVGGLGFGAPKKAVMLPPFGFFESEAGTCSDFRLSPGLTMMMH
jgi:hypothetical protein